MVNYQQSHCRERLRLPVLWLLNPSAMDIGKGEEMTRKGVLYTKTALISFANFFLVLKRNVLYLLPILTTPGGILELEYAFFSFLNFLLLACCTCIPHYGHFTLVSPY